LAVDITLNLFQIVAQFSVPFQSGLSLWSRK